MVPVPKKKKYKLIANSDAERFGGWGNEVPAEISADAVPCHSQGYSVKLDLPPYCAVIYQF